MSFSPHISATRRRILDEMDEATAPEAYATQEDRLEGLRVPVEDEARALARIDETLLPARLAAAGRRLDQAASAFRRLCDGPEAIEEEDYARLSREKDHADMTYRTLLEEITGQKWVDVARRLAA